MSDPNHIPQPQLERMPERAPPFPVVPVRQLEPRQIAFVLEVTGKQAKITPYDSPLRDDAFQTFDALRRGVNELIEQDADHAMEALDFMARGNDWQKEFAARPLVTLLRHAHETDNAEHALIAAGHLVRIMHEEQTGQISPEVVTACSYEWPPATGELIDLVANYYADPSLTSIWEGWLRPDFHAWFETELLTHYEHEDLYE